MLLDVVRKLIALVFCYLIDCLGPAVHCPPESCRAADGRVLALVAPGCCLVFPAISSRRRWACGSVSVRPSPGSVSVRAPGASPSRRRCPGAPWPGIRLIQERPGRAVPVKPVQPVAAHWRCGEQCLEKLWSVFVSFRGFFRVFLLGLFVILFSSFNARCVCSRTL